MVNTYIRNKDGKFYSHNNIFIDDFKKANVFSNEEIAEKYRKMLINTYELEECNLHVLSFGGSIQ